MVEGAEDTFIVYVSFWRTSLSLCFLWLCPGGTEECKIRHFRSVAEWQTFFHKVCSHTTLFNVIRFVQSIPCLYNISSERVVDWVSIVMLRPCALSII